MTTETDRTATQDIPSVCRYLRTKQTAPTIVDDLVLPWEAGENAEACYTCLATQSPVGPDDALAHPRDCRESRGCFRRRD